MADCWQCWKTLGCEFTSGNVEVWHAEGCHGRSRPSAWCAAEEFKSERGGGLKATIPAGGFIVWRLREYVRSVLLPHILSICLLFVCVVLVHIFSSLLLSFLVCFHFFSWKVFAEHTKWFKIKEQKDLKNIFKYIIFHTFLIHPFHTTSPRITGMKKSIPMSWAVGREIPLMDGQF